MFIYIAFYFIIFFCFLYLLNRGYYYLLLDHVKIKMKSLDFCFLFNLLFELSIQNIWILIVHEIFL